MNLYRKLTIIKVIFTLHTAARKNNFDQIE